jgi:hypothetical protein
VYHTDQDCYWKDEDYDGHQDADWEEDEALEDDVSSSWDALAFQQKATFPPCAMPYCKVSNVTHTHSSELIVATSCTRQKERAHQHPGDNLFFS